MIVFGDQAQQDPASVLAAVRDAGFGAIECGPDFFAPDLAARHELVQSYGLRLASIHGNLADIDLDLAWRVLEATGCQDLCFSGIANYTTGNADLYRRDIEFINKTGARCRAEGIHLHYHNHSYEFSPLDEGVSGMDLLLSQLDFAVADLNVDVAWVHLAGHDPAIYLRKHANKIGYVHLKDYAGDRHWVELGYGAMPMESVLKALERMPQVRWAVYEQDRTDRPAAESCAISHKYLVDTFGYG